MKHYELNREKFTELVESKGGPSKFSALTGMTLPGVYKIIRAQQDAISEKVITRIEVALDITREAFMDEADSHNTKAAKKSKDVSAEIADLKRLTIQIAGRLGMENVKNDAERREAYGAMLGRSVSETEDIAFGVRRNIRNRLVVKYGSACAEELVGLVDQYAVELSRLSYVCGSSGKPNVVPDMVNRRSREK